MLRNIEYLKPSAGHFCGTACSCRWFSIGNDVRVIFYDHRSPNTNSATKARNWLICKIFDNKVPRMERGRIFIATEHALIELFITCIPTTFPAVGVTPLLVVCSLQCRPSASSPRQAEIGRVTIEDAGHQQLAITGRNTAAGTNTYDIMTTATASFHQRFFYFAKYT